MTLKIRYHLTIRGQCLLIRGGAGVFQCRQQNFLILPPLNKKRNDFWDIMRGCQAVAGILQKMWDVCSSQEVFWYGTEAPQVQVNQNLIRWPRPLFLAAQNVKQRTSLQPSTVWKTGNGRKS